MAFTFKYILNDRKNSNSHSKKGATHLSCQRRLDFAKGYQGFVWFQLKSTSSIKWLSYSNEYLMTAKTGTRGQKKVLLTWVVREDLILPRALRVLSASSICFSRSAFSTDNFFFVMSASASEVCKSSRRWVLSPMSPCKALFCFSRVVWNRDLHIECSKQFKWNLYFLGRAGRFGQC